MPDHRSMDIMMSADTPLEITHVACDDDNVSIEISGGVFRGEVGSISTVDSVDGEAISISVELLQQNAVFTVLGPDDVVLSPVDETSLIMSLESGRRYRIAMGSLRGNPSYDLRLQVHGAPYDVG
jgi:hypothetical protein